MKKKIKKAAEKFKQQQIKDLRTTAENYHKQIARLRSEIAELEDEVGNVIIDIVELEAQENKWLWVRTITEEIPDDELPDPDAQCPAWDSDDSYSQFRCPFTVKNCWKHRPWREVEQYAYTADLTPPDLGVFTSREWKLVKDS